MGYSWGGGTGQCHQMSQGDGRGLARLSRDIFFNFWSPIFYVFFDCFFHLIKISPHLTICHMGKVGGLYIRQKSVTYYLNGLLQQPRRLLRRNNNEMNEWTEHTHTHTHTHTRTTHVHTHALSHTYTLFFS